MIHAFLTSLLPGERSVDDIFQQTNLVLWKKRDQFRPGTNFRSWVLTVARWETRAWLTERKRESWLTYSDQLAVYMLERFEHADPSGGASDSRGLDHLRECLGKLRDQDRLLIVSHYQHDKSLEECARIFKRSSGSLKVTLFRIRQMLRRCIHSQETMERVRS